MRTGTLSYERNGPLWNGPVTGGFASEPTGPRNGTCVSNLIAFLKGTCWPHEKADILIGTSIGISTTVEGSAVTPVTSAVQVYPIDWGMRCTIGNIAIALGVG